MNESLILVPSESSSPELTQCERTALGLLAPGGRTFPYSCSALDDLKKAVIARQYEVIVICFSGLNSEYPPVALVRSLALASRIVLFLPASAVIVERLDSEIHVHSAFAALHAARSRVERIMCESADMVVVAEKAIADDLGGRYQMACVRTMDDVIAASGAVPVRAAFPLVSIVMLTFNQYADTRACIESIRKHTTLRYELIIVDNNSQDGTREYLEQLKDTMPGITLIYNDSNLGFSKANNQGIRRATGEFVLLLNNDVLVSPQWLERMLACAQSDHEIGLVAPCTNHAVGQQVVPVDIGPEQSMVDRFAASHLLKNAGYWFETHRVIGFCMLLKRRVLDRVGGLDERFGPGGYEDYDYCLRLRQAREKIVVAGDVFLYHVGGKGYTSNSLDYNQMRAKNIEIFTHKWCRQGLIALESLPDGM